MNILKKLSALEYQASEFGFRWETANQIMTQIKSECTEIEEHLIDGNRQKLQEEIGDLLHAVFSLCVFCQYEPTDTLKKSIDKFEKRFQTVRELASKQGLTTLNGKSFEELMLFWNQAKKE